MAKNEGDLPQFGPYENACKYKITVSIIISIIIIYTPNSLLYTILFI